MSAYSDLILSLSPTAYWRFGEASGAYCLNSAYDGGMGWYGNYNQTYHALGRPSLISGDSGNTSVEFLDATYGTVFVNRPTGGPISSAQAFFQESGTTPKAWTFAGWLKIPAFTGTARCFLSSRYMLRCWVLPARTIQLQWSVGGVWTTISYTTTATLPIDEAAFVTVSFDGANSFKITINGVTETYVSGTAPQFLAGSDFTCIGGYADTNGFACKGTLDEFCFFTHQLTPLQISQIYASGTGRTITIAETDLAAAGTSTAEFVSNIIEFDATMAGDSTAMFVNPFVDARLIVESTSTASFAMEKIEERSVTFAGTSTATFFPPYVDGDATMASTSEANFVNATADFALTVAGTSTATFGMDYIAASTGYFRGSSTAQFANAWSADTSMTAHGRSTAKFYDCSIYPSVLTCHGTSFARFRSEKVIERAVTFAGTSTARFDAAPNWDTAATMAGTSTAQFYNAFAEFDFTASGTSNATFAGDKVPQAPTSRVPNLYVTERPR